MRRTLVMLATVIAISAWGAQSRAQDTLLQAPPEAEAPRRPNTGMLIAGTALLGGSYAASAIVGAQSTKDEDKRLLIPLAGPFLDLAERDCDGSCDGEERFYQANLIGSGAAQAAGLVFVVASFFVPQGKEPVKASAVRVLPMSLRGGGGVGAFGTF